MTATPAAFEIQNSVVGNTTYIPHTRARIGDERIELVGMRGAGGRGCSGVELVATDNPHDALR
jgi:excinuclease ABC subunit B